MLVSVRDLVRRMRSPRTRADEVAQLRTRFACAAREAVAEEEVALAREMRALRLRVAAAFAGVQSCSRCAKGRPLPHGRWQGGFCCGGRTEGVFADDEVAALALGGTRARDLLPPAGDHAGCAFRGPTGCSLEPADRPNLCVRFVCRELEGELRASGDWARTRAATRQLEATFARFVKAQNERRAKVVGEEAATALLPAT